MKKTITAIETIIETAEKFKNSYFWSPPGNAAARRSYEEFYSCPMVEWNDGSNVFTAEYVVECTCRCVYAKGIYTRNGKKTTLTAIKNSLKRLQAAQKGE